MVYLGTNKISNRWLGTTLLNDRKIFPLLLLDKYPATAAYSAGRRLKTNQTYAFIVRRELDNTELNIGFDVQGNTDITAIASFCGISDGFVTTWYDATGNGNDATQPISTQQPKIYDGSTGFVVTESGIPALEFNGSNTSLDSNLQQQAGNISIWSVFKAVQKIPDILILISAGELVGSPELTINIQGTDGNSRLSVFGGTSINSRYNNIVTVDHNFQQVLMNVIADDLIATTGEYMIGACTIIRNTQAFEGVIQEMVIYDSNESANRTNIENNINNYYSIY